MIDAINKFFESKLIGYFLFGNRWILLIPPFFIGIYFHFIKNVLNFPDTIKNPAFWIPSLIITIFCIAIYYILPLLRLPKDTFIVAISNFKPVPEEKAKEQSESLRDRLIENIRRREKEYVVKVSVKPLKEIIDCSSGKGRELAMELGRQKRAHIVICGKVRLDEEYFFEPFIINLIKYKKQFEARNEIEPLKILQTVSALDRLEFKKQKIDEITDFVTFVFGLAKYESGKYKETIDIFKSIKGQTSESLFYIATSLFYLNEFKAANLYFDQTIEIKPDYAVVWNNKGNALAELDRHDEAIEAYKKAIEIELL
jgi:tetratricopeptide (TPR) repeat protein